jgi:hypothetical protein
MWQHLPLRAIVCRMSEWHGWPHALGMRYCAGIKPVKLRRIGPSQYRIVSALPNGVSVSIPLGRFGLRDLESLRNSR